MGRPTPYGGARPIVASTAGCRKGAFRRGFHIEHIIARQHGGSTGLDNLAFACWTCNLKKGPNLSGIDPVAGLGRARGWQAKAPAPQLARTLTKYRNSRSRLKAG